MWPIMPATEATSTTRADLRTSSWQSVLAPAGFLVCFGILFYSLLASHMVQPGPAGLYSGGSTWGDLAWHLSMISNFAQRGVGAVRENPIFPGAKLSYPFLPDLLSAWLLKQGLSLQGSLIWPTLFAILAAIIEMYFLARSVEDSYEALWVPFLFLFNGTLAGMLYFWQDYHASQLSFLEFAAHPPHDYAHLIDHNIQFSNVISDYVLPQRAMVFGLALGLVAVRQLWNYWNGGKRAHLFYAGLALSLIPLVHFHSFVALALAAAALFVIEITQPGRKQTILNWLWFAVPVLLLALPQVVWIAPAHSHSFFRLQPGWMAGKESAIWFWLKNLSPHIFVFAAAWHFSPPRFKRFWAAFLMVFLISNILIFQPHDFDNMKLMLWSFLISCVGCAVLFAVLRQRYGWKGIVASLLLGASLSLTGTFSVYREFHLHWLMFSNDDIALANYVRQHTPADAIFLTSDKHNHPIPCLAGRRIIMGYRGWLWTHGIDYHSRESDIFQMYSGSAQMPELMRKYDVSYVLLEFDKWRDFHENLGLLLQNYPTVYQGSNYILLQVK
jgi:hypothetical protein